MDRSQGESPLSNLTEFLPEKKYYTFTRKADATGTIITESITLFTGFSDGQYHRNRELRAPSPIIPERMLDIWKSVNQPYIVISTMEHV